MVPKGKTVFLFFAACALCSWGVRAGAAKKNAPPVSVQEAEFFEARVRPVLAENCFSCHGPLKQKSGLRLDSRSALLKGSENGPVIDSGEPGNSRLIQAVRNPATLAPIISKGLLETSHTVSGVWPRRLTACV